MTVVTELGSLPVFAGIPTDELSALAAELTPVRARVGEVLMRQGEKATSFFIIASGEVEVRHTDSDGITLVAFLSEGLLGEIALLRNAPRTATVVATDEVRATSGTRPPSSACWRSRASPLSWCGPRASASPPS